MNFRPWKDSRLRSRMTLRGDESPTIPGFGGVIGSILEPTTLFFSYAKYVGEWERDDEHGDGA